MSLFLALHKIATPRGDGLRPELSSLLLRQSKTGAKAVTASKVSGDCEGSRMAQSDIAPPETELHERVLRFPPNSI